MIDRLGSLVGACVILDVICAITSFHSRHSEVIQSELTLFLPVTWNLKI